MCHNRTRLCRWAALAVIGLSAVWGQNQTDAAAPNWRRVGNDAVDVPLAGAGDRSGRRGVVFGQMVRGFMRGSGQPVFLRPSISRTGPDRISASRLPPMNCRRGARAGTECAAGFCPLRRRTGVCVGPASFSLR